MTLRLLPPPEPEEGSGNHSTQPGTRQQFAAGAPPSPGPLPDELRAHLPRAEALVWWDEQLDIQWHPVFWTFVGSLVILGLGSLIAPEFWLRRPEELAPPLAVLISPVVVVGLRAWFARCSLMLTDTAWVRLDMNGRVTRLPLRSIRRIAKDVLFGGVLLEGPPGLVRVPGPLTTDAQRALASQSRLSPFGTGEERPIDTVGWLPRARLN